MAQPREVDGPHHLPQGEQERCAVEGRLIDGSGLCKVVAIRDRKSYNWVVYPHGAVGPGVLIAYEAPAPSPAASAARHCPQQHAAGVGRAATGTESASLPDARWAAPGCRGAA